MDFSKCRRIDRQVGRGFAVMCPNGAVMKFKVKAFRVVYDADGRHVEGVELDMAECMAMGFSSEWVIRENGHCWFRPEYLYRNKGDCARGEADRVLDAIVHMKEAAESEKMELEDKALRKKDEIRVFRDKLERMEDEYRKRKWWIMPKHKQENERHG